MTATAPTFMKISGLALPEALSTTELDSVFWTPSRAGAMSAWWGHVPFAHWLVAAIRPRIVVELGTHNGVSFAAFCEAMQRRTIAGRCYAVDTWKGDEHAGFYEDNVFHDLNIFNQSRYSSFSELIRLTFDEALPYFTTGSIDLLHIDGLHTYEAVKGDFEKWLPKLSDRGVVLLHDTNVREREFGVWKLWAELGERYPSFEFMHGHGLGIAAVGRNAPETVIQLCNLGSDVANILRERFAHLGARWMALDLAERTRQHVQNITAHSERQSAQMASLQGAAAAHASQIQQQAAQIEQQAAQFEQQAAQFERQAAQIEQQAAQVALLTGKAARIEALHRTLQAELTAVYASRSWRITAPFRAIKDAGRAPTRTLPPISAPIPPISTPIDRPADADVELIANSGLFDESSYRGAEEARALGISSVEHYILKGEAAGFAPSASFDPVFYCQRHPDLREGDCTLLSHYIRFGKSEGRSVRSVADTLAFATDRLLAGRETVVVVVHEATRTGAAILAWNIIGELQKRYNVITILKQGGPIEQAFAEVSCGTILLPMDFTINDAETDALARKFVRYYSPKYVVANSAETRYFVPSFERVGVPAITLIHEFSGSIRPLGSLHGLLNSSSEIVFSARIVAESVLADYRTLEARPFKVLAQGVSRLPANNSAALSESDFTQGDVTLLPDDDDSLLVIGIGTITARKGVEFFIAAAASVQRQKPSRRISFRWAGKCYGFDQPYLDYLNEQINRSGVEASFAFIGEFEDLEPIYARADICFLSSRLDPLPNIAIDSAVRGIPVICFDQASGIAEILKSSKETQDLVVPYLDADAAARLIVELAHHPARLSAFSEAMRVVAKEHFDMAQYVEAIDRLGQQAVKANDQVVHDHQLIARSGVFNVQLNVGPQASEVTADEAIRNYLHGSRLTSPRGRPRTGMLVRRPLEGFHPLIYASDNPEYNETTFEDPLAHYIRTGFPAGRWQHEVIRPHSDVRISSQLRVAVHGHFYYPQLLTDFLARLRRNRAAIDLLLTTTSDDRARTISQIVSSQGVERATVMVVPNRGRDIGSLLTGLNKMSLFEYDVIGHFHSKRSPHTDVSTGEVWRNFLWENLVGGKHGMLDVVMEAFASDRALGLVFPEDPHLNDWDENRVIADQLAARMGLPMPLPNHFDFPVGTMFWARPAALKPLMDLDIAWDEYPNEPLAIDGTLLHALERLVPFSTVHAGYRYATTYLKECVR
jgi:glycosyltransferase involved in cell wall biosynthesis